MDERSTLRFSSNIYPTSTNGELINDRRFLASISDPEALNILWRYNGSNGGYLNALQLEQHEAAEPCVYAESGDYPWGTLIGNNRIVCLCERVGCPRYPVCVKPEHRLESYKPLQDSVVEPQVKVTAPRRQKASSNRRHGTSAAHDNAAKPTAAGPWTEEENKRLVAAYPKCTREALYTLFPYRDVADVDAQVALLEEAIRRLSQHAAPKKPVTTQAKPKQAKPRRSATANETHMQQQKKPVDSAQQKRPKKKRKKSKIVLKTWTVEEDVLIRRNYPQFGSNTRRWSKPLPGHTSEEIDRRAYFLGVRRK